MLLQWLRLPACLAPLSHSPSLSPLTLTPLSQLLTTPLNHWNVCSAQSPPLLVPLLFNLSISLIIWLFILAAYSIIPHHDYICSHSALTIFNPHSYFYFNFSMDPAGDGMILDMKINFLLFYPTLILVMKWSFIIFTYLPTEHRLIQYLFPLIYCGWKPK